MKRLLSLVCVLMSLFGCARQPQPTIETVAGKYIGTYKNAAVETLELRPDLTFVQELSLGGKVAYHNEGTWRLETTDVVLDHFYRAVLLGSDEVRVPSVATNNVHGLWVTLNGRSEIVFDVEHNYRIKKQ